LKEIAEATGIFQASKSWIDQEGLSFVTAFQRMKNKKNELL